MFQMFYLTGHEGPVNQAASNINRSVGDETCIHGDVVMLTGDHILDRDEVADFYKPWGNA